MLKGNKKLKHYISWTGTTLKMHFTSFYRLTNKNGQSP